MLSTTVVFAQEALSSLDLYEGEVPAWTTKSNGKRRNTRCIQKVSCRGLSREYAGGMSRNHSYYLIYYSFGYRYHSAKFQFVEVTVPNFRDKDENAENMFPLHGWKKIFENWFNLEFFVGH